MASSNAATVGAVCDRSKATVGCRIPASCVGEALHVSQRPALPVLREGVVLGVITEAGIRGHEEESAGALTQPAVVVHEGDLLCEVLEEMRAAHTEHAVVVEDGRVVGMLSDEQAIHGLFLSRQQSA